MDVDKLSHRRGKVRMRITEPYTAMPKAHREVIIRQSSHKFLFGCAGFTAVQIANSEPVDEVSENAFAQLIRLFNYITLPFYWERYEPVRGNPAITQLKNAAQWMDTWGYVSKGHPLCWHTLSAPWLMELTNKEIMEAQVNRVTREVGELAGYIDIWDVLNEPVIMPEFKKYDNAITRICKEYGRVELAKRLFKAAREANPNAVLLINDFDTSERYAQLIEELLEAGVPIDAIGVQSHMHQGYWGLEKLEEVLERFSRFGLPIHFTEVSILSGDLTPASIEDLNDYQPEQWPTSIEGEFRQYCKTMEFYSALFEHPLVEAITWWSLLDGGWLGAPSGLIRATGRNKLSYDILYKLFWEVWYTRQTTVVTDENGFFTYEGFKGSYKAVCDDVNLSFSIE